MPNTPKLAQEYPIIHLIPPKSNAHLPQNIILYYLWSYVLNKITPPIPICFWNWSFLPRSPPSSFFVLLSKWQLVFIIGWRGHNGAKMRGRYIRLRGEYGTSKAGKWSARIAFICKLGGWKLDIQRSQPLIASRSVVRHDH